MTANPPDPEPERPSVLVANAVTTDRIAANEITSQVIVANIITVTRLGE